MAKRTFLAENIKYFRRKNDLTQEDLAARIGVSRAMMGAYEEGRCEPKLAVVLAISKLFNVSIEALLSKSRSGPALSEDKQEHDLLKGEIHRKLDLIKHLVGDIEQKLAKNDQNS